MFRLADAKPYHCGRILRRLRDPQRAAFATLGLDAHRQLRDRFGESSFKRAWLIDGELAGLGGVTGSPLSTTGLIWLALTPDCARFPRQTIETARMMLAHVMATREEVYAVLFVSDAASVRFARFLGFEPVDAPAPDGTLVMVHRRWPL